jgi:halocyanin-like protein
MKRTRRTVLRSVAGAGLLGAAGTASAQEGESRPAFGAWLEGIDGGYVDARGQDEVTVQVGADGNGGAFAFAPAGLWVDPGTTVRWRWTGEGGGHNVISESGPADLDSGAQIAEAGVHYEYEFTEEDAGINEYYCDPHLSLGMKGAIAVGGDVPTEMVDAGGGGGGINWRAPGGNIGLALIGFALGSVGLAVLSVFGADWYAGRKRRQAATEEAEAPALAEEAPAEEPEVELSHEEFDPWGTATLVAVYFVILVLLWAFMYFVEFLGNGPTVIG